MPVDSRQRTRRRRRSWRGEMRQRRDTEWRWQLVQLNGGARATWPGKEAIMVRARAADAVGSGKEGQDGIATRCRARGEQTTTPYL